MVAPLASCYRKACRGRRSLGEGALTHLRAKAKNHYGGTEPRSREELPFLFFLRDSVSPWWVLIFLVPHNLFDSLQILFRVDADGVERRFCHVNRYSVLQKAQLLQPLAALERRLWPAHELVERVLAIAIEPKMFVISRTHSIAVVRDGRPRKIQGPPCAIRHHLHRARIVDVNLTSRRFQRPHLD